MEVLIFEILRLSQPSVKFDQWVHLLTNIDVRHCSQKRPLFITCSGYLSETICKYLAMKSKFVSVEGCTNNITFLFMLTYFIFFMFIFTFMFMLQVSVLGVIKHVSANMYIDVQHYEKCK
jgi:hypothetical protein